MAEHCCSGSTILAAHLWGRRDGVRRLKFHQLSFFSEHARRVPLSHLTSAVVKGQAARNVTARAFDALAQDARPGLEAPSGLDQRGRLESVELGAHLGQPDLPGHADGERPQARLDARERDEQQGILGEDFPRRSYDQRRSYGRHAIPPRDPLGEA